MHTLNEIKITSEAVVENPILFTRFKGTLSNADEIKVIANVRCPAHLFIIVLCQYYHDDYAADHWFMGEDSNKCQM